MGLAPQHVGSSWTRVQTRVPCTGRQIPNHWATREALVLRFECCDELRSRWWVSRRQRPAGARILCPLWIRETTEAWRGGRDSPNMALAATQGSEPCVLRGPLPGCSPPSQHPPIRTPSASHVPVPPAAGLWSPPLPVLVLTPLPASLWPPPCCSLATRGLFAR